ncbi:hypothetical protein ACFQGK_06840 [Cellulomonas gelida]|uniref:Uncharacterized protein n=1 Tax=Cellulomonas gelida TaxID=1712 RepID=A0A4Y3KKC0_9CELL|nr:hypothetical protein [Cellulomonas gelida]GEA84467.1 hypothetical protein CGE01nite_17180 [Cellulomonas gelida]GGL38057.1 hypothetical protein GCM10009774_30780 [Cellulomonas gelida]
MHDTRLPVVGLIEEHHAAARARWKELARVSHGHSTPAHTELRVDTPPLNDESPNRATFDAHDGR